MSRETYYPVSESAFVNQPAWEAPKHMAVYTAKQISVPTNPNFMMVPIFLKNFFLLMLYPDGNIIKGKSKSKKSSGENCKSFINSYPFSLSSKW